MSNSILEAVKNRTGYRKNNIPSKHEFIEHKFYYASADPGAGKTTWAVQEKALKLLKANISVMIVVPTTRLSDEISESSNSKILALHSGKSLEKSVQSNIIQTINKSHETGEAVALVITDVSYMLATELFELKKHILKDWVLIKDEPRDPLNVVSFRIGDEARSLIEKFICTFDEGNRLIIKPSPRMSKQEEKEEAKTIREQLDNIDKHEAFHLEFDDVDCDIFGKLAIFKNHLNNPFYEVIIDRECLNDNKEFKYSAFAMPAAYSMFGQCIFMKANFEDSFIYHQWKERNVKWVEIDKKFAKMPTKRVKIHYYTDNEKVMWSKTYRDKFTSGKKNLDLYTEWLRNELKGEQFVYVANNVYTDKELNLHGTRMPAECHGLNSYRHHTNVALLGSYLIHGEDEPLYNYYNTSTTDAFAMRQTQYYVQQITRTDIRNYDSDKEINVYVPSLTEALSLMTYMPDATIIHPTNNQIATLSEDFDPVRKDDTIPSNRNLSYGSGVKFTQIYPKDVFNGDYFDTLKDGLEAKDFIHGRTQSLGSPIIAEILLLGSDTISSNGLDKERNKEEYNQVKTSLNWVSPGIYNQGDRLTKHQCQGSNFIGLDFDGTDITDAEFVKIFGQWEYLQYTTFSHKIYDKKRRLRIILPYERVVSIEEHTRICTYFKKEIEKVINPKGTLFGDRRESGLDIEKMNAHVKLFCPHKESDIKWIKRKNNRATIPVEVDYILAKTPKLPKVKIPTVNDLVWKYVVKDVKVEEKVIENIGSDKPKSKIAAIREMLHTDVIQIDERETKIYKNCVDMINTMSSGNRSVIAMKVAGIIGKAIHNMDVKHELYNMMVVMGIDDSAKTQVKKYSGITGGYRNTSTKSYKPLEKQTITKPVVTYKPKQIETVVQQPVIIEDKNEIPVKKQGSKKWRELMNMGLDFDVV